MKVLELNPLDDEARISLRDLEGEPIEEPRMPIPEETPDAVTRAIMGNCCVQTPIARA